MKITEKSLFRRVAMMLVALTACLAVTSCGDGEYYNSPLVGRWALTAPAGADYNEYYFYPDGTGQYYVEDFWGNDYYNFVWDTNGPYLDIYFRNGDTWSFGWSVQGYSLYLYSSGNPNPYVYTYY